MEPEAAAAIVPVFGQILDLILDTASRKRANVCRTNRWFHNREIRVARLVHTSAYAPAVERCDPCKSARKASRESRENKIPTRRPQVVHLFSPRRYPQAGSAELVFSVRESHSSSTCRMYSLSCSCCVGFLSPSPTNNLPVRSRHSKRDMPTPLSAEQSEFRVSQPRSGLSMQNDETKHHLRQDTQHTHARQQNI